jgi:hypothetical protein
MSMAVKPTLVMGTIVDHATVRPRACTSPMNPAVAPTLDMMDTIAVLPRTSYLLQRLMLSLTQTFDRER